MSTTNQNNPDLKKWEKEMKQLISEHNRRWEYYKERNKYISEAIRVWKFQTIDKRKAMEYETIKDTMMDGFTHHHHYLIRKASFCCTFFHYPDNISGYSLGYPYVLSPFY